jgi:hypothetical protein
MTVHRLIAPRELAGVVALSNGRELHIPPSGIVELDDRPEIAGDTGNFEPQSLGLNPTHLRELLALGFRHAQAAGGSGERPPGRHDGEQFFDVDLGRPLWWWRGAWRDANGRAV